MKFSELERNVIEWAAQREIFSKATPLSQMEKTEEEVQELRDGLETMNLKEVEDAIGDIVVTLIIQAHMHGLGVEDCLEIAFNEIKDRKGKMVDGMFVKDGQAA